MKVLHILPTGAVKCRRCGHTYEYVANHGHAYTVYEYDALQPPMGYDLCKLKEKRHEVQSQVAVDADVHAVCDGNDNSTESEGSGGSGG